LTQRVFKLSTNQRFETIVRFLRKRLGVSQHESVFCYVGSVFAPSLDEGVGNLWTVSDFPVDEPEKGRKRERRCNGREGT
jgi:ubiquitin-like protein ATG12